MIRNDSKKLNKKSFNFYYLRERKLSEVNNINNKIYCLYHSFYFISSYMQCIIIINIYVSLSLLFLLLVMKLLYFIYKFIIFVNNLLNCA